MASDILSEAKALLKALRDDPAQVETLAKSLGFTGSPGPVSKPDVKSLVRENWKPRFHKSAENPDEKQDAQLGENVEGLVERHFKDNKAAEAKEGHNLVAKAGDGAGIVMMSESKHDRCVADVKAASPDVKNPHAVCVAEGVRPAKWKKSEMAKTAPAPAPVPAPMPGSQKPSAMKKPPVKKPEPLYHSEMKKTHVGFEAVKENAAKHGARNPGAVAAAVGNKKYGKEAMQRHAHEGKPFGKDEDSTTPTDWKGVAAKGSPTVGPEGKLDKAQLGMNPLPPNQSRAKLRSMKPKPMPVPGMIKDELEAPGMLMSEAKMCMKNDNWAPRFHKSAEAGPNPKALMANKIIKPSDTKNVGPASIAVTKPAGVKMAPIGKK